MNATNQANSGNSADGDLKTLLRRAATSEQAPPHLRVRIAESLRLAEEQTTARRRPPVWMWSVAALASTATLAMGAFLYRQDVLPDEMRQASYIARATSVGDHQHAAASGLLKNHGG